MMGVGLRVGSSGVCWGRRLGGTCAVWRGLIEIQQIFMAEQPGLDEIYSSPYSDLTSP